MRTLISALALLLLMLMAGCLPGSIDISVKSIDSNSIVIAVDGAHGHCDIGGGAKIQSVWVGKMVGSGPAETVWHIRSKSADGKNINSIAYGVVPEGFAELQKAAPLTAGALYDAEVSGHGCDGGVKFRVQ